MALSRAAMTEPAFTAMPWRRRWLIAVTCLVALLVSFDPSMISVANPRIADALHASLAGTQWITSAFLLSFTILLVGGGTLADRFGRSRLLLAGLACFTAGELGAALAGNVAVLVVARLLVGVGAAAMLPAAVSVFRAAFPPERASLALGVWIGCAVGGAAVAPLLTGWLLAFSSWRLVFWVMAGLAALLTGVSAASVRGAHAGDPGVPLHPAVTSVLTAGLGLLVWGLIRSGSAGWGTGTLAPTVAGTAVLVILVWVRWPRAPVRGKASFAFARISAWLVVVVLASGGFIGTIFLVGIYLQRVQHASPFATGLELLPFLGVAAVAAPTCGRLAAQVPKWRMLVVSLVLELAGLVGLSRLGGTSSYAAVWPFLVPIGLAFALMIPAALDLLMRSGPPERGALLGALQTGANQLGGVLAVAALGSLIAATVAGRFRAGLSARGVHIRVSAAVAAQLAQGVPPSSGEGSGHDAALVQLAGLRAFSESMDLAFLAAALAVLCALLIALALPGGFKRS